MAIDKKIKYRINEIIDEYTNGINESIKVSMNQVERSKNLHINNEKDFVYIMTQFNSNYIDGYLKRISENEERIRKEQKSKFKIIKND